MCVFFTKELNKICAVKSLKKRLTDKTKCAIVSV